MGEGRGNDDIVIINFYLRKWNWFYFYFGLLAQPVLCIYLVLGMIWGAESKKKLETKIKHALQRSTSTSFVGFWFESI